LALPERRFSPVAARIFATLRGARSRADRACGLGVPYAGEKMEGSGVKA